jgi:hypothetical protein
MNGSRLTVLFHSGIGRKIPAFRRRLQFDLVRRKGSVEKVKGTRTEEQLFCHRKDAEYAALKLAGNCLTAKPTNWLSGKQVNRLTG